MKLLNRTSWHHVTSNDSAKLYLSRELQAMKGLISEYESQKKVAMQADIEQLMKISQKYSKAL